MSTFILIEDMVVPQLLTTAFEAYEVEHKTHSRGKGKIGIETYGLLWGYVIPERNGHRSRIVCTMATVETSALRHEDWVQPNLESLRSKAEFVQRYWPQLELVGTFHSHPYESLSEVNECRGWQASDEDQRHWPWIHESLAPELPHMVHLIVTIAELQKKGWAYPDRLPGGERDTGFVLSSDWRKFWIKAYTTEYEANESEREFDEEEFEDDDEFEQYIVNRDVYLSIPSLTNTFKQWG